MRDDLPSAIAVLQAGHFDELEAKQALADLDRAIELDPDDAEAVGSRGQAYRLLGREQEALADFVRATELDPGYEPAGGQSVLSSSIRALHAFAG